MNKITIILVYLLFLCQIDIFAAGTGEKEYFFENPASYTIPCSKEDMIKKLNKIAFRLMEFRLSEENDLIHIQFRTQPFNELPKAPIFNAGYYDERLNGTFYFNFIFNNQNKTITLVSGKVYTNINNFPNDDIFIQTFETNILNYIKDEGIIYNNRSENYQNTLFAISQINKVEVCLNLNYSPSWGSRVGDGLQKYTIRNNNAIERLYKLDFLSNTIELDEKYYWYRFPDIIIAIEYELTREQKDSIVKRINNEMNSISKEELEFKPPTPGDIRSFSKKELFEKQLIDETGPRMFLIHIWKNNEQYLCQISDSSIYCLVNINTLNDILKNALSFIL
jgi:hypothetical protein